MGADSEVHAGGARLQYKPTLRRRSMHIGRVRGACERVPLAGHTPPCALTDSVTLNMINHLLPYEIIAFLPFNGQCRAWKSEELAPVRCLRSRPPRLEHDCASGLEGAVLELDNVLKCAEHMQEATLELGAGEVSSLPVTNSCRTFSWSEKPKSQPSHTVCDYNQAMKKPCTAVWSSETSSAESPGVAVK
ncbi:hypothetical protein EVAR_80424_1 [Eumeta japonica]|uniref:Uncharacterized protein n=1 Tax=Eumeta variegata TaxID=151549 RepID=A0A4C1VHS5_EUMVA|nr:hypothetical protein EVAR_80424_1 [Eumeta japonica]